MEIMRKVMLEFDLNLLEESTNENVNKLAS